MENQSRICFYFYHLDFLGGNDLHSTPLRSTLVDRDSIRLPPTMKGKGSLEAPIFFLLRCHQVVDASLSSQSWSSIWGLWLLTEWQEDRRRGWCPSFPRVALWPEFLLQPFPGSFPVALWFPEATLTVTRFLDWFSLLILGNPTLFC